MSLFNIAALPCNFDCSNLEACASVYACINDEGRQRIRNSARKCSDIDFCKFYRNFTGDECPCCILNDIDKDKLDKDIDNARILEEQERKIVRDAWPVVVKATAQKVNTVVLRKRTKKIMDYGQPAYGYNSDADWKITRKDVVMDYTLFNEYDSDNSESKMDTDSEGKNNDTIMEFSESLSDAYIPHSPLYQHGDPPYNEAILSTITSRSTLTSVASVLELNEQQVETAVTASDRLQQLDDSHWATTLVMAPVELSKTRKRKALVEFDMDSELNDDSSLSRCSDLIDQISENTASNLRIKKIKLNDGLSVYKTKVARRDVYFSTSIQVLQQQFECTSQIIRMGNHFISVKSESSVERLATAKVLQMRLASNDFKVP